MTEDSDKEYVDAFLRWVGLNEFVMPGDGSDTQPTIPFWKLPGFLGVTGCIKLAAMIATIIAVAVYGHSVVLEKLGDGVQLSVSAKLAILFLLVPALLAAVVVAKAIDVFFRAIGIARDDG